MNLAELSIKRPVFITCIVVLMLALGALSFSKLPVDLFPDVTFPVVMVMTPYPGAGPQEVENLISKPLEDEINTLPGIKTLRSISREGMSTVVAEFSLETDIKHAEQQIRDRVGGAKRKLPEDILEPIIRRIDPADQPILILTLTADLPDAKLYDLATEVLRPRIEQVDQVGSVDTIGGRKREIRIDLDRAKLKAHELSVTTVAGRIGAAGQNVPVGKINEDKKETVFRTVGEFKSVEAISSTVVAFFGNDVPVTVADLGKVADSVKDETARVFVNGKKSLFLMVFRQSGSNTLNVADRVKARVQILNDEIKGMDGAPTLEVVRDGSRMIRANVDDVKESIILGILLTIFVVYLFLGSGRSTIITGLALPNSLIGAFLLMAMAGFTINVMSLLALSLAVGLLIDDAIVVRENIYRHGEMGKDSVTAALEGTKEVSLAVIATTLTVIAVFGSIGFLQGVVGQFFKEFGLTICFAMMISLFDAFTMAPMLSAYFAGVTHTQGHKSEKEKDWWDKSVGRIVGAFGRYQDWQDDFYAKVLRFTLGHRFLIIGTAVLIFFGSLWCAKLVPKTMMPASDAGEFLVSIEMPPGTNIEAMSELTKNVDKVIRSNPEIGSSVAIIGGRTDSNAASFFMGLTPSKTRKLTTTQVKDRVREQLKEFSYAKPLVKDIDMVMGGVRPFALNIVGNNLEEVKIVAAKALEILRKHPGLSDIDTSDKPGKPEYQVVMDDLKAQKMGVSTVTVGQELRAQVEGIMPAVYREGGNQYDIRVRLQDDQRNLKNDFDSIMVPNINYSLIKLSRVSTPNETTGPVTIDRQDKSRFIQIGAEINPKGPGLGATIDDVHKMFKDDIKLPDGVHYTFVGQADTFKELMQNMILAAILGTLFVYLVLASLYESFMLPFTIMLVLPLAASGAFFALFLAKSTLDIFSMIGCIMLIGVSTKNSILLIDYTNQLIEKGMAQSDALIEAGRTRLRPILMTTGALIAGMLPIAIGLNEASKQRVSMGIAVIGGLLSSTLLTLVVIPASYSFIDNFRKWSSATIKRLVKN